MTKKKMPGLQQAGTTTATADEALALIGGDPETLILAIRLMDRMISRRKKGRRVETY